MDVSFQHANPNDGNESFLIRFHDRIRDQTACVLVDAGPGVDVDSLIDIENDEYLAGILLTHAHLDHYATLPENHVQNAPIFGSVETARILEDVLTEAQAHHDIGPIDGPLDAIHPIDGWESIVEGVRVHPVPAGHAPGAAGFLLQFQDNGTAQTLLATGDFTTRDAAGFRGFTTDLGVEVDAVFLTASTNGDVPATMTDAVSTALARAQEGSTTLVTAGALQGVHLATLLAETATRFDVRVPITLVGQTATVASRLGYDLPNAEFVETFEDPQACLERGRITIAGPAVPIDGSAERLFDAIESDGGATLLQVTSGGLDPVETASCTVDSFRVSNHPSRETADEVVEELLPTHVVVVHQTGHGADRYKDSYDSFVWATDDRLEHTLYEDGRWRAPPWVTEHTERRVRNRTGWNGGRVLADDLTDLEVAPPSVSRRDAIDLDAEGLDVETLERRFDDGRDDPGSADASPDRSGTARSDRGDPTGDERETESETSTVPENHPRSNLERIESRLERIEAALDRPDPIEARVISLEDGVLLRPLDADELRGLEHGDVVELRVETDR